MNEDQKKLIIIGSVIAMIILFLVLAFHSTKKDSKSGFATSSKKEYKPKKTSSPSKKDNKSPTETKNFNLQQKNLKAKNTIPLIKKDNSRSSLVSTSHETETRDSLWSDNISREKQAQIDKLKQEAIKHQKEYVARKLDELSNDPNTDANVKLRITLQKNKTYVSAYNALLEKDYQAATENFIALFKDKNSKTEVKFIALEGLQTCAKFTGNLELYIYACKQMGKMISQEDLALFKIKKNDAYSRWANEFSDYMHARTDRSLKDKLVRDLADETLRSYNEAEIVVNNKISTYEGLFGEFIN